MSSKFCACYTAITNQYIPTSRAYLGGWKACLWTAKNHFLSQLSSKKQIHSERQISGFSILDHVCFPSEAIAYIEESAFADRLKYGGGLFTLKLEFLGTT